MICKPFTYILFIHYIHYICIGRGITEIGKAGYKLKGQDVPQSIINDENKCHEYSVPHVSFYDPKYVLDTSDSNSIQAQKCHEFFQILAICHEVIAEQATPPTTTTTSAAVTHATSASHTSEASATSAVEGATSAGPGGAVSSEVTYSAPNPDDHALVCAAKYFGYSFLNSTEDKILVQDRRQFTSINAKPPTSQHAPTGPATSNNTNSILSINILNTISFTSKRKCMSILVRHPLYNNQIILYCKGADSAIIPKLSRNLSENKGNFDTTYTADNTTNTTSSTNNNNNNSNSNNSNNNIFTATEAHAEEFANEGLRVLYIASRIIPDEVYHIWCEKYKRACTDLTEIERKKRGKVNSFFGKSALIN